MVRGKARQILALLLIGLAVGAWFACQIHTPPLAHEHATSSTSHAHSSASSLLDFACMGMAAILPTLVILASFLFQVLYAPSLMVKHTLLAFPPFVPPRHITR